MKDPRLMLLNSPPIKHAYVVCWDINLGTMTANKALVAPYRAVYICFQGKICVTKIFPCQQEKIGLHLI